jgi:hypothetical protein
VVGGQVSTDGRLERPHAAERPAIEWLQALLLLAALVAVLLWKPLTSSGYFTPSDLLNGPMFGYYEPARNIVISDVIHGVNPYLNFSRAEIRSGQLPLWNPYNGAGAPLLGNSGSATLSIFTLPFYVLSFRTALVVSPIMKLLAGGMGAYAFVRLVRGSHISGVIAAVGYMLSAFNIVWLSFTLPSVAALLPWLFVFAHLSTRGDPDRAWLAAAGLGLTIAATLFAGHLEVAIFTCLFAGAYLVGRLSMIASGSDRDRFVPALSRVGIAIALGCSAAAVQCIPFAEYIFRSSAYALRSDAEPTAYLDGRFAALHAFPGVLGDTITVQAGYRYFNYAESAGHYVGLLMLFLALAGAGSFVVRRRFTTAFFAVSALVWLLYAYDVAGAGGIIRRLPVVGLGHVQRSSPIWLFSVSVLAGVGFDFLRSFERRPRGLRRRKRFPAVAVGAVAAATLLVAVLALVPLHGVLNREPYSLQPRHSIASGHVVFMAMLFVTGAFVTILACASRRPLVRRISAALLVGVIALQSGLLLRNFNPTVPAATFYPTTEPMRVLRSTVGDERVLTTGSAWLYPNINLWYRLHSPELYDALGVRQYDRLYRALMRVPEPRQVAGLPVVTLAGAGDPASLNALQALGIGYVATSNPYPYGVPVLQPSTGGAPPAPLPLVNGEAVRQDVVTTGEGFNVLVSAGASQPARCHLTIADATTGTELRRTSAPCNEGASAFSFPEIPGTAGRRLTLTTWSGPRSRGAHTGSTLISGLASNVPGLELVTRADFLYVYRVPGSARFSAPARAQHANDEDSAITQLRDPLYRPDQTVVVEADTGENDGRAGRVTVVSEDPTRVRLDVERRRAGWVVARLARFPGWRATVNGDSAPIATADGAFMAVRVPAGHSTVVLEYEPASVRLGLAITALSLVALLAIAVRSLIRLRRRSVSQSPSA